MDKNIIPIQDKSAHRICGRCHQEYKVETGLHNWKNLFRMPTLDEWITLFIIIMVILSAYAYKHDIENLNSFYEENCICGTADINGIALINDSNSKFEKIDFSGIVDKS